VRLRLAIGLALGATLAPAIGSAQVATGDSAWAAGEYYRAQVAYETALRVDPAIARALYRLGILASWAGQLDSSLTLLARARAIEPRDPEIRLHQAKVLSWAGRYRDAVVKYDSLLAEDPSNQQVALGRARTLSWSGRLDQADAGYATMLARDPSDIEALAGRGQVALWSGDRDRAAEWFQHALELDPGHMLSLLGMAQVRQYQTRPDEATQYINQALAVAPNDRDVLRAAAEIRALRRAQLEAAVGWSRDSDKNILWWQKVGASYVPAAGLRVFGSVGLAEASDPFRNATRLWVEGGGTYGFRRTTVTGAIGLRSLSSDTNDDTILATWRAYVRQQLGRTANAGVGYSRYAFDETALLISEALRVDEIAADGSLVLRPKLTLTGTAAYAFFDDGNRRPSGSLSLMQRIANNYSAGVYGRVMGYTQDGYGYFTPDLFFVAEGRGTYWRTMGSWTTSLAAGLGLQQAGSNGSAQFEYNFEARLARRWGAINEVALVGALSNSQVSSTTGAFRYYTALLTARIGL
jgi:tetratricopeptide (TPR) repeat protein